MACHLGIQNETNPMCVANDFKLWLAINICWIVKFQNLKAQNEFDYEETNIPL